MSSERISGRLVSPFVMWLIVALGVTAAFRLIPRQLLFEPKILTSLLLILTAANWIYFFFGALRVNRSPARSAGGVTQLVTQGVYAKVRHPIYSADIFLAWGIVLFKPEVWIAAAVAWMTIVLVGWMKLEEAVLLRRFGDAYAGYQQRTPMILPRYFG